MKFSKQFSANQITEWREYYMNYKKLKHLLKAAPPKELVDIASDETSINRDGPRSLSFAIKRNPLTRTSLSSLLSSDSLATSYSEEPSFMESLKREVERANRFYLEELARLDERLELLLVDLRQHSRMSIGAASEAEAEEQTDAPLQKQGRWTMESIKRALRELYRRMVLLQNFTQLNYTATVKVHKKYRKITDSSDNSFITTELHQYEFVKASELLKRISAIEDAFCHWFTGGDVLAARSHLLAKQRIDYDWRMFRSGMHFGLVFVLLAWVLWDAIVDGMMHPSRSIMWQSQPFLIYRGLASITLMMWCIGINLFVWNKARINYLYIFALDPESTSSYAQMFTLSCNVTIFYLCSFLLFTKVQRGDFPDWIPSAYYPVATFIFFLGVLIFPIGNRLPLLKTLASLFLSPFVPVSFYTAYVADVLTSLVKPIVDLAFSVCFVFSGEWLPPSYDLMSTSACAKGDVFTFVVTPILIALPLWIRLMQCLRRYQDTQKRWPHLGNAGKYAVSQTVVLFGAFHPHFKSNSGGSLDIYQSLWVVALVMSTLYTFSWDVKMDWGLGNIGANGLRGHLMFDRKRVYYATILADLFLRFSWTLTLLPGSFIPFVKTTAPLVDLFLAMLEVLRRTMWGFFRLEWEHLSNTEQYRSVNFIPLHFDLRSHKEEEKYPGWRVGLELVIISAVVLALAIGAALSR